MAFISLAEAWAGPSLLLIRSLFMFIYKLSMDVILLLRECIMYINGLVLKLCYEWWKSNTQGWQQGTGMQGGVRWWAKVTHGVFCPPSLGFSYCSHFWLSSLSCLLWWELKFSRLFFGLSLKCFWRNSNVIVRYTCPQTSGLKLHEQFHRHPQSTAWNFLWVIWKKCHPIDKKPEDEFLALHHRLNSVGLAWEYWQHI